MGVYVPRLEAPSSTDKNWIKSTYGGYNYCIVINETTGSVLPNCTGYAWGRWRELLGKYHKLSRANAENWYGNTGDGYKRGKEPKLGAVMCWHGAGDLAGHVAVVEQINDDGSIVCSESNYGGSRFSKRTLKSPYNISSSITFQGFIYIPIEFDDGVEDIVPDEIEPISKNAYLTEEEMKTNALYIYLYMKARGWTLNAIAGMLGNMEIESTINPGIWQNLEEYNLDLGFGLVQWTPATNYIEWATQNGYSYYDMDANLDRIIYELNNGLQWISTETYPMSFDEFTVSTESPSTLASIFLKNYERAGIEKETERQTSAEKWYAYLLGIIGTIVIKKKKKFNFLFRVSQKRMRGLM